jgi:hypothetical protein
MGLSELDTTHTVGACLSVRGTASGGYTHSLRCTESITHPDSRPCPRGASRLSGSVHAPRSMVPLQLQRDTSPADSSIRLLSSTAVGWGCTHVQPVVCVVWFLQLVHEAAQCLLPPDGRRACCCLPRAPAQRRGGRRHARVVRRAARDWRHTVGRGRCWRLRRLRISSPPPPSRTRTFETDGEPYYMMHWEWRQRKRGTERPHVQRRLSAGSIGRPNRGEIGDTKRGASPHLQRGRAVGGGVAARRARRRRAHGVRWRAARRHDSGGRRRRRRSARHGRPRLCGHHLRLRPHAQQLALYAVVGQSSPRQPSATPQVRVRPACCSRRRCRWESG